MVDFFGTPSGRRGCVSCVRVGSAPFLDHSEWASRGGCRASLLGSDSQRLTLGQMDGCATNLPGRIVALRVCGSLEAARCRSKATREGCPSGSHDPHFGSYRKPSSLRCSAQSIGSRAVSRINFMALSCGGCRPLTTATVMSGASQARRRRI